MNRPVGRPRRRPRSGGFAQAQGRTARDAIALWSVTRNMGPGWEDAFLEAYGIRRDPRKIAYYHLLYDLQP